MQDGGDSEDDGGERPPEVPDGAAPAPGETSHDTVCEGLRDPEETMAEAATRDLGPELSSPDLMARLDRAARQIHLATSETTDLGAVLTPRPLGPHVTQTLSPGQETTGADLPFASFPQDGLGRYQFRGVLGRGGMGEVLSVYDPTLKRELAMKVLAGAEEAGEALARFQDEAQVTAQLQHPGVVPVHEMGRLPDGRIYFTMQVVRGRTLRQLAHAYHESASPDAAAELHHLITVFNHVCETIAFAHRHGMVHRDLKPENVMVGEFGEVRVLDWGLAKRIGGADGPSFSRTIRTHREAVGVHETLAGEIMGTPVYMSPEQARGQNSAVTRASDVYALCAVLFHILTGKPPFEGAHAMAIMMRVVGGLRAPLEGRHPIPRALRQICDRGMSVDPAARYPDAEALQRAVGAWLSGAQQRERALQLVHEARQVEIEMAAQLSVSRRLAAQAESMRRGAELVSAEDAVLHGALWDAEDAAAQARLSIERLQVHREQLLHAALTQAPDAPEVRTALARAAQELHTQAEAQGDTGTLLRAEASLREHAEALPPVHPDRAGYLEYLAGDGLLNLHTEPAGARVEWFRWVERGRRLQLVPERELRPTPIRRAWLPQGSHLLVLRAEGRATLRYPVSMSRLGRWDAGVADAALEGEAASTPPILLPGASALGPEDLYVAPGPCILGGDADALESPPRETVELAGFVIRRTPVTNGQYMAFVNDLALQGNAEAAMRYAPRVAGVAQYTWQADMPVVLVDRACADAYAAWLARREGRAWRLPTAQEWEKAARGVDARLFPWGDFYHAAWANLRERRPAAPTLLPVGQLPVDESPYGARDMAGNVREWVHDEVHGPDGRQCVVKGGGFLDAGQAARCAGRIRLAPDHRDAMTGFRLARSL